MRRVVFELTKFYRKADFQAGDYFVEPSEHGSKVQRMFHYYDSSTLDEREIDALLYPEKSGSDKAFMMLRKDLIERLLRYVLVLDPRKFSPSKQWQQYFNVIRNSLIARTLLYLGLYKSGLYVAKNTIRDAKESEIWDVVYTLSSILNNYYAIRDDSHNLHIYEELADFALQRLVSERKLRKLINKWTLLFGSKRKASLKEISELKIDVDKGDEIVGSGATPNLLHINFRLKLFYLDAVMDYEGAIEVCNSARKILLSNSRHPDLNKLGIYDGTQMYCYLNLRKFDEARAFAEKLEDYFVVGTLNWYINTEFYFVLSIQTQRYQSAYEQLQKALSARTYDQLKGVRRQMWNLFEGYMQFIISSGLWKDSPNHIEVKQFKVAKFLNEVVSLSGDKTGIHVSILILQILFLLLQGRFEDIIDRKDALRRYVYRYLYSKENERSRIFLSMLLRIIECDFSYAITKQKTQRLFKSLREQQMNYQANLGGNEIVDYEVLWNWVLETMKNNWVQVPKTEMS